MSVTARNVDEVAPGVFSVSGSRVNWYVLVDGGEVTLVDTGYPGDADHVLGTLAEIGYSPADVTAVLITHGHVDHIGAAELLRREHGAVVHTYIAEAANVSGERQQRISNLDITLRLWQPRMMKLVAHALRARARHVEHVTQLTTFGPNTGALDVPGRPVPVPTPGHTSGHCAFHLPHQGVLITGDCLVTLDVLSLREGPRLLPPPFNHDHARTIASLEAIRDIDAQVVLPGHGAPYHGSPADAVERALARLP